jgi:transposase
LRVYYLVLRSSKAVHISLSPNRRPGKEKSSCQSYYTPAPEDAEEERKVRKLAGSRHAPGDWIFRARIVSLSWRGLRTARIAEELGCHPKSVRKRLHRFNTEGIDGLGDHPGAGRKPRITQDERSKIIALVAKDPPGKLLTEPDGVLRAADETKAASYWTLDTLADGAQGMGIAVGRSQVRRILLAEGVRWRNTRPWAESAYLRSSSQKVQDRRALHRPAAGLHGGLRGRARTHHSTLFPSGSGMVAGRMPHQSASGIQP